MTFTGADAEASATGSATLVVGLVDDAAGTEVVARLDERSDVAVSGSGVVEGLAAITVDVPTEEVDTALSALQADAAVRYAERDAVASAAGTVVASDPERGGQTVLDRHRVQAAWQWTTGSPDVTVAVVDTGVSPVADMDDGRLLPGHDFVDDDDTAVDDDGHGTMVAGIIAAAANNGVYGAGICWSCQIMPVRVLARATPSATSATGNYSDVAAGIVWAADHGADVVNLSLGGAQDGRILRDAVQHAHAAGAVVVAAAGNLGGAARFYPAGIDDVISVSATYVNDQAWSSSGHNSVDDSWVDLITLGQATAVDHTGRYRNLLGTSAAAPVVAGTAALARSLRPDSTPADMAAALDAGGDEPERLWFGAKRLDAAAVTGAWGESDATAPTVVSTGLAPGQLICDCTVRAAPTVEDNRDVSRVALVVADRVVATDDAAPWSLPWRPSGLNGPVIATVRAYDDAGNVGVAETTVQVDSVAPNATITAPAPDAEVRGIVPVTVTSSSPDVAKLVVGKATLDTVGRPGPWSLRADLSGAPDGDAAVDVHVYDRAGNRSVVRQWVTVDTVPPMIRLDPGEFSGPTQWAFFNATVIDQSTRIRMELLVNGRVVSRDDHAPFRLDWLDAQRYNGVFRLTFRAIDGAGLSSEVTRTITLDNTAPKVRGVSPAYAAEVRSAFTASVSGASDASGIAQVRLLVDGRYYGRDTTYPYAIPVKLRPRRSYVYLTYEVVDRAGNVKEIVQPVRVDGRAPVVSIWKGPGNKAKVRGKVTLGISARDDLSGIARVELLVNGKVVASDKTLFYRLTLNTSKQKKTMKIRVRAYDRAGNVAYTSTRTWRRR